MVVIFLRQLLAHLLALLFLVLILIVACDHPAHAAHSAAVMAVVGVVMRRDGDTLPDGRALVPAPFPHDLLDPLAVERHGGDVGVLGQAAAHPPLPVVGGHGVRTRVLVVIQFGTHPFGRCSVEEWVVSEQRADLSVVDQKSCDEVDEPGVTLRLPEASEPHEPVESVVIWRDPGRGAVHIARLHFELVVYPVLLVIARAVEATPLNHHFVSLLGDRSECAVGVDKTQRREGRVHDLTLRLQVSDDWHTEVAEQTQPRQLLAPPHHHHQHVKHRHRRTGGRP
mmetsp:Transcript_38453/g.96336  ORF Transcript_38453/g.96336 Transcript_38453/m.96336 type:complete len:282 (-) Transcript_38453:637-1482(-)